jgi:hypothetical protein
VVAPEPVSSATGAAVLGGLAAGTLTVSAAQEIEGDGLPDAGRTTSEIEVPEQQSTGELGVPAEQQRVRQSELGIPDSVDQSEITVDGPEGTRIEDGEIVVPTEAQQIVRQPAQEERQRRRERREDQVIVEVPEDLVNDEEQTIGEDPTEPVDRPENVRDIREQLREERRTRPQDREQQAQEPDVQQTELVQQSELPAQTQPGGPQRPILGGGLDQEQGPTVGPDIETEVRASQEPDIRPQTDDLADVFVDVTQQQDQQLQLGAVQTPLLDGPGLGEATAAEEPGFENPNATEGVTEQVTAPGGGAGAPAPGRGRVPFSGDEIDDDEGGDITRPLAGLNETEFVFDPPTVGDEDGDGVIEAPVDPDSVVGGGQ